MTDEEIRELKSLQESERFGDLDLAGTARLHILRTALARDYEKPDDPATPFIDESSRPLLDGSNYNDTLHRMTCDELGAILERVGRAGFEVAVAAVLKR